MNEKEMISQLKDEGFSHTYVWEDVPNERYSDHSHSTETAHIILSGEMTLTKVGKSNTYHTGERRRARKRGSLRHHGAHAGCRYLIGER